MKIRNGFVSNSSSSSFVVGFKDKNVADIFKKMFQCDKLEDYYEEEYTEEIKKKVEFENVLALRVPYGSEEMFENIEQCDDFKFCWED